MKSSAHIFSHPVVILLLGAAITFQSCKDKKPEEVTPIDQNENPSYVQLILTDLANPADSVVAAWNDPDGVAETLGKITVDTIKLKPGSNYQLRVSIQNRTVTPLIDLTDEITEEKNVHQFFFKPSPMNLLTVDNLSKDSNNLPFGLQADVHTTLTGPGTLQVDLDHFDAVKKAGTNRSGSTDISVTFPVEIR